MTVKMEQCQFSGQRMTDFMGNRIKTIVRCQERGTGFWHDDIGDAYCPRHEHMLRRRAVATVRPDR